MENYFFKKKKNIFINDILFLLKLKKQKNNHKVDDIKTLESASRNDITFLHSTKYIETIKITKSKLVITNQKLIDMIPNKINTILVSNVLISVAKITSLFYPNALDDNFDKTATKAIIKDYPGVKFGKNILLGKNVRIGKNSTIGHNTIIEHNVRIGNNCNIGSNVIIRNTIVGNHTNILDGAIIGKKGFGFFPGESKNIRYPHVGSVMIGDNVEIGCHNTIDRGSLSNTIIGDGTFIDNQVHIAHNVKIGKNCIITGQVGFAGSSSIGNRVMIGGQAGISGHLTIGDNVQIGGGSGVIKNIPSNSKVMGYPAKNIRNFLKESKLNDWFK